MLRIVAVNSNIEMYGSDRMFLRTLELLLGDGDLSIISVVPGEGLLADAIRQSGIELDVRPFPVLRRVETRGLGLLAVPFRFVYSLPGLVRWLRRECTDVVYVNTITCPIWIIAGRLAGSRVVCHVRENEPGMRRNTAKLLLAPLRFAHVVLANSEATRNWIQLVNGPRKSPVVIYNGFPLPKDELDSGLVRPIIENRPVRLLVVGRLSIRKGQDVAIDAISSLKSRGYSVELIFVGEHYPGYEAYVDGLKAQVRALGLDRLVSFAGFQSDTGPYFRNADIVLVPSRIEPFGNVAVEALLARVPVVVSDVDGLREIVRHGETGVTVAAGDSLALADAVASLIDEPTTSASMARAGYIDACQRFGIDRYREALHLAISPG